MASGSTTKSDQPPSRWFRLLPDQPLTSAQLPGPSPKVMEYRMAQAALLNGYLQIALRDLGPERVKALIAQFLAQDPEDLLQTPNLERLSPSALLEVLLESSQWFLARGPAPEGELEELGPVEVGDLLAQPLANVLQMIRQAAVEA